jgi:hypothetical protein
MRGPAAKSVADVVAISDTATTPGLVAREGFVMAMFRQLTPGRNLGFVVDFLDVDKSLVWPGGCHAKDFPLAVDDGSDYGSEQAGEVENLLEFLPLFAEADGVRILRALFKHVTAVCIAAHDRGKLPWCRC